MYALPELDRLFMSTKQGKISALVVEDDSAMADLLKQVLEGVGIRVRVAYNGVEGMNYYLKRRPDIVFSNFIMPEMNGAELFRRIREMDSEIPIVLFSGRVWELNLHFQREPLKPQHILAKPVKLERIYQILRECFPQADFSE